MSRTFTATASKKLTTSVFHSNSPAGSAAKAFNTECKGKTCKDVIKVTDKCSGKEYAYMATRKYNPTTVNIGGTQVLFKYSTKLKSVDPSKVASLRKTLSNKPTVAPRKKRKVSKLARCIQKCKRT